MSDGGLANLIHQINAGGATVGRPSTGLTIPNNTDPTPYIASINPRYVSAPSNNGMIPLSAFRAYKSAGMQGANDAVRSGLLENVAPNTQTAKNRRLPSPAAGK